MVFNKFHNPKMKWQKKLQFWRTIIIDEQFYKHEVIKFSLWFFSLFCPIFFLFSFHIEYTFFCSLLISYLWNFVSFLSISRIEWVRNMVDIIIALYWFRIIVHKNSKNSLIFFLLKKKKYWKEIYKRRHNALMYILHCILFISSFSVNTNILGCHMILLCISRFDVSVC